MAIRIINYSIAFVFAVMSAIIGMFLPDAFWTGPFRHPINLLWGSIYGVGWFVAGKFYRGVRSHEIAMFGFLIWPLIVMFLVTALLGTALQYYPKWRKIIITVAFLSLCLLIPKYIVPEIGRYLPLWSEIFAVVY